MQRFHEGSYAVVYKLLADAMDKERLFNHLPSAAFLAEANLYSETLHAEVQQYSSTELMIEALRIAGLLTPDNKQVVIDLLYACKTIKLRQEHKSSRNKPLVDEHAALADFMQRMARRELLSARLCKVVFSDITWTQNQAKLEKLLGALEPLTTRKIDNILGSVFDWMAIQEQMEEIDSENNCFRYLVEHVQPENYNVVSSCLMNCRVNGYRHWLTPAYLMASLENAFDIHEILRAYHLLHKSGTWLLNLHFQEVAHNKPIRQALIQLDEAGILLSGEADNASHALRNTSFSDAVAILREAKIINSFEKAARKYYDADVTLFSKKDSRMLMDFLLTSPEHCEKLIVYTDHVFPLYTHEDESFEFHQDVLVKLLNTMLSKTNYLLLHSPKSHHEDRRVDEAIEKLEELLQRECGQACKM